MLNLKVDDELELEPPCENRVAEMFAVIMANYEYLREWLHWVDEDYTLEKALGFNEMNVQRFKDQIQIKLSILYGEKFAGIVTIHDINQRDKSGEIGYWIAAEYSGKGLVTKSVVKLLEYGFEELKLNRIVIKCVTENLKSRAIPERLGFVREGFEREGGWLHTRFVDHIVYSMLAKEWEKISEQ